MTIPLFSYQKNAPLALMGGCYGNIPALEACLADAREHGAGLFAFLGDITGCCGHSDETIGIVRKEFDVVIAGNHEQKAAEGAQVCGCGYSNPEDEKYGCMAHQYAMGSLSEEERGWLKTLPDLGILETGHGRILLCHGSPAQTNEFLYESRLDEARLEAWLEQYDAVGLVCTHTGLPWVRRLTGSTFAANCGVVGKSDHDGDPAVHYSLIRFCDTGFELEIRRVTYDHESWARQMEAEGVHEMFVSPVRTGLWTVGVGSMPDWEQNERPKTG